MRPAFTALVLRASILLSNNAKLPFCLCFVRSPTVTLPDFFTWWHCMYFQCTACSVCVPQASILESYDIYYPIALRQQIMLNLLDVSRWLAVRGM
jgi:hypothetical protein